MTFAWLAVLFETTRRQRSAGRQGSRQLQRKHSTNLRRLSREPSRVLASSLFWLDGRSWWPYVPVFVAVVAPAERRLRSARWLLVGVTSHVVATLVGQGYLRVLIRRGRAPRRAEDARDVGVSYFVLGVAGALTAFAPQPWRTRARVAGLAALAVDVAVQPTFTEVGHATAFVVGLSAPAWIPAAPDRPLPR